MNERTAKIPAGPAVAREPGEWDRLAWLEARLDLKTDHVAATEIDGRHWFALSSRDLSEKTVAANMIGYGIKIYLPMKGGWEKRQRARLRQWILRPMFPGYLFGRFSLVDDLRERRMVSRVRMSGAEFVMFGDCYAVVSDDVMRKIASASDEAVIERDVASIWGVGEEVRIGDGVFTGFNAKIHRLDHRGRIEVLLSLFGRLSPVQLNVEQIEKL
jgi:transcription antitermination factor NusG